MVKEGLIPRLVDLLPNEAVREVVLKLLYHLSMDDKHKSMFTFTDAVPIVSSLLVFHAMQLLTSIWLSILGVEIDT